MLVLASTVGSVWSAPAASESARPWHEPLITYVGQTTPQAEEIVTWAVAQYRQVGLQLPDLTISFPALCDGKGALYHVGKRSVEFCRINKRRALHEFAHAWDDTSGAVDRQAFLELRGLSVWWGGTDMPSDQQGAEQLAQIVAWHLMGSNPDDVPQLLPHNSVAELTAAYQLLTGHR